MNFLYSDGDDGDGENMKAGIFELKTLHMVQPKGCNLYTFLTAFERQTPTSGSYFCSGGKHTKGANTKNHKHTQNTNIQGVLILQH